MRKTIYIALFTFWTSLSFSQSKIEKLKNEAVAEGKKLYESEMASWYGTDLFVENYKYRDSIGGYFSYSENDNSKCIFFSKGEDPKVIGTITFDKTYNVKTANIDLSKRAFSTDESDLYIIRKKALTTINSDTIFKQYENTSLNLIPLISNGEKKVYVITAPQKNGVVIFGNDYLLTFDRKNNLKKSKRLHKGMIVMPFENNDGDENKKTNSAFHSHLPEYSEIMTATDICTTMLYQKFTEWEQNYVMSKKYVSIWDCKKEDLFIMTMEAWKRIANDKPKN